MSHNWKKFLKHKPSPPFARALQGKLLPVCSLAPTCLKSCFTKVTIFAWPLKPRFIMTTFHTALDLLPSCTLTEESTLHFAAIWNQYVWAEQTLSGLSGQSSSSSHVSSSNHSSWEQENCFISAGRILQSLILLPKRGLLVGINILSYLQKLFSSPILFPSGLPLN